jgi:CheY-like chemotaxis protein
MKTLLYVDDSPDDRFLFQKVCERTRASFQLKTVNGGIQAIRYLSGEKEFGDRARHPLPDLIFLDLKMPEMDGFQVLRWIRSKPATCLIPVALYTGSFIAEDIANGSAEGANFFISKPPQLSTLAEIVRAADECLAADITNCAALQRFSAVPPGKSGT